MPDGSPGFSLLIVITAEFGTGIQLGFGFTLIGVGGLLGLNRTMRLARRSSRASAPARSTASCSRSDVVANAPRIISDLRAFFPPQRGHLPDRADGEARLGHADAGQPLARRHHRDPAATSRSSACCGSRCPPTSVAVIVLQVNFVGALEFDKQARLLLRRALRLAHPLHHASRARWACWSRSATTPNFVLSRRRLPPDVQAAAAAVPGAEADRASASSTTTGREIRVEGYFAVTTQHGAVRRARRRALRLRRLRRRGAPRASTRCSSSRRSTSSSTISASVSVKVFGVGVFSDPAASSTLEGPTPWRAQGTGSISLLFFEHRRRLRRHLGRRRATRRCRRSRRACRSLVGRARQARELAARCCPPSTSLLVSLRKLDPRVDTLVLHPVGALQVSQRAVPLDLHARQGRQARSRRDVKRLDARASPAAALAKHARRPASRSRRRSSSDFDDADEALAAGVRAAARRRRAVGRPARSCRPDRMVTPRRALRADHDRHRLPPRAARASSSCFTGAVRRTSSAARAVARGTALAVPSDAAAAVRRTRSRSAPSGSPSPRRSTTRVGRRPFASEATARRPPRRAASPPTRRSRARCTSCPAFEVVARMSTLADLLVPALAAAGARRTDHRQRRRRGGARRARRSHVKLQLAGEPSTGGAAHPAPTSPRRRALRAGRRRRHRPARDRPHRAAQLDHRTSSRTTSPHVEFYDEDFPWRYTPAAPDGTGSGCGRGSRSSCSRRTRVRRGPRTSPARPLPFDRRRRRRARCRRPTSCGRGRTCTSTGSLAGATTSSSRPTWAPSLAAARRRRSRTNRDVAYSRLVCPRRLDANTRLPRLPRARPSRPAGSPGSGSTRQARRTRRLGVGRLRRQAAGRERCPYYHRWYFRTGAQGDFEYLVRLLEAAAGRPARRRARHRRARTRARTCRGIDRPGPRRRPPARRRAAGARRRRSPQAELAERERVRELGRSRTRTRSSATLAAFVNLADDYARADGARTANAATGARPRLAGRPGPADHAAALRPLARADAAAAARPRRRRRSTPTTTGCTSSTSTRASASRPGSARASSRRTRRTTWTPPGSRSATCSRPTAASAGPAGQARGGRAGTQRELHAAGRGARRSGCWRLTAPAHRHVRSRGGRRRSRTARAARACVRADVCTVDGDRGRRRRARAARLMRRAAVRRPPCAADNAAARASNAGEVSRGAAEGRPRRAWSRPTRSPTLAARRRRSAARSLVDCLRRWPLAAVARRSCSRCVVLVVLLLVARRASAAVVVLVVACRGRSLVALWRLLRRWAAAIARSDVAARGRPDRRRRSTRCRRSPDFVLAEPGAGVTPTPPARPTAPQAARFKDALRDWARPARGEPRRRRRAPAPTRLERAATWRCRARVAAHRPARHDPAAGRCTASRCPAGIVGRARRGLRRGDGLPADRPADVRAAARRSPTSCFLPNLNLIAPNSITLLETNQKFIEAYMVGLNHEFARELLWREYPTDQRGSTSASSGTCRGVLDTERPRARSALKEKLHDIPELHRWPRASRARRPRQPRAARARTSRRSCSSSAASC